MSMLSIILATPAHCVTNTWLLKPFYYKPVQHLTEYITNNFHTPNWNGVSFLEEVEEVSSSGWNSPSILSNQYLWLFA